jgi:circadian clock protein KaiC
MASDTVPTGIPGLDKIMGGGLDRGSVTLISGKAGTGKSIFSLQFVYSGTAKFKESALYITTEETADYLRKQAANFGWDMAALEKSGSLYIMSFDPFDIDLLTTKILDTLQKFPAKRVVIDSVSMFELYVSDTYRTRKAMFKFLQGLKQMGITIFLTAEIPEDSQNLSRSGVLEFLVDSVVVLQYMAITKYKRSLLIRKMRMRNHSMNIHPFEIGTDGIRVQSVGAD